MNIDEIRYEDNIHLQGKIIEKLNEINIKINSKDYGIKWGTEAADKLKISKGVFAPISKEDSFIMGYLVTDAEDPNSLPIEKRIANLFEPYSLKFTNVKFYIHAAGVAQCSVQVEIEREEKLSIVQIEQVSEDLNQLFKEFFEEICYQITLKYNKTVRELDVPMFDLEHLPDVLNITKAEKSSIILPWSHRIYHIHDKALFQLENPGDPFKFLLTPSKKMDIVDFSIYDNRYIYFGWGHSIVFTKDMDSGFSQTNSEPYEYVRLVEIAQVNWRSVEVLDEIMDTTITWFNLNIEDLDLKTIKTNIYDIRDFNLAIKRIIDNFRNVKITFDTEKRNLLRELHERWKTEELYENLDIKLDMIEDTLEDLYQRQKEKKDDSLNTIVLAFTIISLVDVFSAIFDIISTDVVLTSIFQIIVLISGVVALGLLIILYLRLSERKAY
ncbi:MAG: hypothetical protein GF317_04030 [Candidatus Lokiarchaeota archaeon]|nr:hypothetical protein [Candidatus Lokiarchaeota archaeon]MBD3199055.1 hypothetical protein [Candidatus Lokiarchaeota archaeon]